MNIFGMHWTMHLIYLATITGGFIVVKTGSAQANFLQSDLGQVRRLAIPKIEYSNRGKFLDIERSFRSTEMSRNEQRYQAAQHALKMVSVFSEKCNLTRECLEIGVQAARAQCPASKLAEEYYQLGDSLRLILPQDSVLQSSLQRCLFADASECPPQQLVDWLNGKDSTEVYLLIQNLHLKAVLALNAGLTILRDRMEVMSMGNFDGMLPMISFGDCPQAGRPFQADIFLAAYSTTADNLQVKVDGRSIPLEKGLVHYTTSSPQHISVSIEVKIPLNGEIRNYEREFHRQE